MARVIIRRGNDQVVTLVGLRTTDTGQFLNAANVKATLRDSREQPIPAFSNIQMQYVPESDGAYQWQIEADTMMLPKSVEYSLEIKAVQANLNYRTVHVVSVIDGEL